MTYSPDPLTHSQLSDSAQLWSSQHGRYCSAADPCPDCAPAEAKTGGGSSGAGGSGPVGWAKTESKAEPKVPPVPEPEVRMVYDDDAGTSEEKSG